MSAPHRERSLTSVCLLAAASVPILYWGIQIAAIPFYPGYSISRESVSMLGTRFSRQPWIFNAGEFLIGFALLAAALGLYRFFRRKTHVFLSGLIGLSVACSGVMTLKAGLFPMPDPRHNSWAILFNVTALTPYVMLIALWNRKYGWGMRAYLLFSAAFLFSLIAFAPRLGPGSLQRLASVGSLLPVGVVGFCFWLELRQESSRPPKSPKPATRNGAPPGRPAQTG